MVVDVKSCSDASARSSLSLVPESPLLSESSVDEVCRGRVDVLKDVVISREDEPFSCSTFELRLVV